MIPVIDYKPWNNGVIVMTKHHILPKALGGKNVPGNIVLLEDSVHKNLCAVCNRKKGKRLPVHEMNWRKGQLKPEYHIRIRRPKK